MLSCLRDARTSIAGVEARAFCPANLKANLAEHARPRRCFPATGGMSPTGIFCLNCGGTSE
jgi:hypothetical protein